MTLIELIGQDAILKKVAGTNGGEYAGPCPWCGGRDRFRAWPNAGRPRYWCRRCGKTGDRIQYLRDRYGLSFREACQRLRMPLPKPAAVKRVPQPPCLSSAPGVTWQTKARAFTEACEQTLWTRGGLTAMAYLQRRGLHSETIRAARVGYHAAERSEPREAWGLAPDGQKLVWLPRGLVFPWYFRDELWRVVIRRVGKHVPKGKKYVSVSGGGNTLYRVETLQADAPAMIVEGVFDALALAQEAGDLIAVVAAGSTTGGRLERWIGRLALAPIVLVTFDADEAGEAAAAWWRNALGERAKRWRPYWDDPSAMLQDGVDVRGWVREGLGMQHYWWRQVAYWPKERQELWMERAAIMGLDGGLLRDDAERAAFTQVENSCCE
jgi:DNA primase